MLLAYRYVFVAAMMHQVNEYAPRMHLPIGVPVQEAQIRFLHVSDPVIFSDYQHHSGRLQVTNYSFTFGLHTLDINNLDEYGFSSLGVPMGERESSASGMERASRMKYVVSTNDVHRIATNWLAALDIDIQKLEAANPPNVSTQLFKSHRGWVPSPLVDVQWSRGNLPDCVYVSVSAVTGELLVLRDGDGRFRKNKQPLILTNEVDKLIAIPDQEFLEYTPRQRADLVEKFAGIKGNKDFLTNIPTAFYNRISKSKRTSRENAPKSD